MVDVDVAEVLSGLKGFQRDAVEHVIDRFYRAPDGEGARRYLIADETGLGKSIVARGVIARAIEHLETVDDIDRIDIVYVCSNSDLASQNLRRLNVTKDSTLPTSTRLTMLARDARRLRAPHTGTGKKVNLVSFTPATSFETGGGWRTGNREERALIALILDRLLPGGKPEARATRMLLQRPVRTLESFVWTVERLQAELGGEIDEAILAGFERLARDDLLPRFQELRDGMRGKRRVSDEIREQMLDLTASMRQTLAQASVDTLEPDLVILDEFQRFRDLLDPQTGPAAELAQVLFDHRDARVLLLSATPYKPFTGGDESGDDHWRDFLATIRFLAGRDESAVDDVRSALDGYRNALLTGGDVHAAASEARRALLPMMSRSERPLVQNSFRERDLDVSTPTVEDLIEFARLQAFGSEIEAPIDIEYWKSIPYFANFMDGYKPGERTRERFGTPEGIRAEELLAGARSLDQTTVASFGELDLGNGYLRALAKETVGRGWWRMLWMPPSMPYLQPGPIYESLRDVTKRVVFSAWSGVPTSVASLLSYWAESQVARESAGLFSENTPAARQAVSERLVYPVTAGEVGALSTLSLFWPHPGLAAIGDPLAAARDAGRTVSASELETRAATLLAGAEASQPWDAFFSHPAAFPVGGDPRALVADAIGAGDDAEVGLIRHIESALERMAGASQVRSHPDLARLAAHAPGVIAYRALARVAGTDVSPTALWAAAFSMANSLRRLFNRTESIALLVGIYGQDQPYWDAVLKYCADGNLQAVLDEYVFQLKSEMGRDEVEDASLQVIAERCGSALRLRTVNYDAHDTTSERQVIRFTTRFALRYGGRNAETDEKSGVRQGEVRAAFNSPFAPFVLVSTSVGQEGIDFHWWSHAVLHWNPSNPVDFEQREGRVNRFAGHAIRKNVAKAHWADVLASDHRDSWNAAFSAATRSPAARENGEFAPWWVYPGGASIERIIAKYPLSREYSRMERLRESLALYRLTLGQPRQEDLIALLEQRGVDGASAPTIDLRPPVRDT
ncbi:helicase [Pseudolysinimonas kribbensis]|uniref:Helicase n=1 Tax=Pseudolysinimonas kribbensis TaxID=433641 RepID=A0ABQ6K7N9_9MICO|nr:helicase-related protein [Pseudolysinimonas kribbensis]GMA96658.1 helicase [Pseudolysinimonas kribbensis]